MKAIKKMGSPARKTDGDKGQALADTSREAENDAAGEMLHQLGMRLQTSFPKWRRTSLRNLVVILDLELRPTTCTVLAVAAAPCLVSALVACIY